MNKVPNVILLYNKQSHYCPVTIPAFSHTLSNARSRQALFLTLRAPLWSGGPCMYRSIYVMGSGTPFDSSNRGNCSPTRASQGVFNTGVGPLPTRSSHGDRGPRRCMTKENRCRPSSWVSMGGGLIIPDIHTCQTPYLHTCHVLETAATQTANPHPHMWVLWVVQPTESAESASASRLASCSGPSERRLLARDLLRSAL
jgi:hypothetical protein